jgi:hypothetical protein
VQVSLAPVAPNLQKKKRERAGEVGLSPAQLALENKKKTRSRATEMPPSPERVVRRSSRKLPARVAEAGANNSAGCTGTHFQLIPMVGENIQHTDSTKHFSLIVGFDHVLSSPQIQAPHRERPSSCIKEVRRTLKTSIPCAGALWRPTHGIVSRIHALRVEGLKNYLRFYLAGETSFVSPVICQSLRSWSGPFTA